MAATQRHLRSRCQWWDALDVDIRTEENYRSILRNRIKPRWGDTALAEIKNLKVLAWAKNYARAACPHHRLGNHQTAFPDPLRRSRRDTSHVAAAVEQRLLQYLQHRWDKAVIDAIGEFGSSRRSAA
jgi:hypothetical protein